MVGGVLGGGILVMEGKKEKVVGFHIFLRGEPSMTLGPPGKVLILSNSATSQ